MKVKLATAVAISLWLRAPASAHRLDEYLQATILSVEKDRVQASMRLVPGVAVSSAIVASIDTNADGVLSATEQRAYTERVLRDVALSADGQTLKPELLSFEFPPIAAMNEGLGEIQIEFAAKLMPGAVNRKIVFQNHHLPAISAYLVNCLAPQDHDIQVVAQHRNLNQSFYELDYAQSGAAFRCVG